MELLLVPASRFATWLVDNINRLLTTLGLDRTPAVEQISYIVVIVAVAVCLGWALRHILLFIARKYVAIRHGQVGRELLNHKVLERTSQIIPPLVILACLPIAFETKSRWLSISERALVIYSIIMTVLAICAIFDFIWNRYNDKNNEKHPLKGILISAKGVIWIVATIVVVSVMVDKSPATLLAGLGAFAAALMLIFKDSILGFVAGVQLSQNDMLRVGDWIVVPSTQANGIVIDVSLIAVKVQNWDNTIVTLPPYTLISNSFQNWRGMSESGVRQIARSLTVV
ncbi:MAG: mechanosensitive ion channel family protein, partial [Muribaculaceae bacterium]|nr:mechanosensitive ion channel family protein [Muribaculaceae bacterium]